MTYRKLLYTILRLLVTAGLLWALASRVEIGHAVEMASNVSLLLLAAASAALVGSILINAVRWQVILATEGLSLRLGGLVKLLFVGLFFNQVLPAVVGGDVVRAWRCHRLGIPLGAAMRSILIDRASGYAVTVVAYVASLPTLLRMLPDPGVRAGILAVLAVALAGLFALPLMDFLPTQLMRLPGLAAIADLSRAARRLVLDPGRCTAMLGLSILTFSLTVLASKLVGDSLGVPLSFATWLVIVPPLSLIQLAPVSLAGWGVREAAMVVVLAGFGVPNAAALAMSVLMGLVLIIFGLPGGLIWLVDWDIAAATSPAIPSGSAATANTSRPKV